MGKFIGVLTVSCKREAKTLYAAPDSINNKTTEIQTRCFWTLPVVHAEQKPLSGLAKSFSLIEYIEGLAPK